MEKGSRCGFEIAAGFTPAFAGRRSHRGSDSDIHQAKGQALAPQSAGWEHPLAFLVLEVLEQAACSGLLVRSVE